jgi:tripeptidyl-peptidase-1
MLSSIAHSAVLALLAAAGTTLASPVSARSPYAVKDTHHVPSKWTKVGAAPSSHIIHLQIGLKQSQFDELERHLYEGE